MTFTAATSMLKQAALAGPLLWGSSLPTPLASSRQGTEALTTPCAHEANAPSPQLFSPREAKLVAPYLAQLPVKALHPHFAHYLVRSGQMKADTEGVVLDQKHLIPVSWDERGIIFHKSIFRSPRYSHSAFLALHTTVEVSGAESGAPQYILRQRVTVISFLPSSAEAIASHVRIDVKALASTEGVKGTNWQGLDFLFAPQRYLSSPPISVSAALPIPISNALYRAIVLQAVTLDAQGKPYHVLSSLNQTPNTENCITGCAGVLKYLPGELCAPATGPLRGQEATDFLTRAILAADGNTPSRNGRYDTPHTGWILREVLNSVPAARSGVTWYALTNQ